LVSTENHTSKSRKLYNATTAPNNAATKAPPATACVGAAALEVTLATADETADATLRVAVEAAAAAEAVALDTAAVAVAVLVAVATTAATLRP